MKKLLLSTLLAASLIFAQENSKGRINLVFNGEKIDIPISTVTIMKQNNILVSARAEHNDSTIQQVVSLEIGLKNLSSGDSVLTYPITININVKNILKNSGKNLTFSYNENGAKSGNEKNDFASYGVYSRGESLSWNINRLQLSFNITDVIYTRKELKITGSFSGTFASEVAPKGQTADIKDGKFEIIL
jgi:hypothetical protein